MMQPRALSQDDNPYARQRSLRVQPIYDYINKTPRPLQLVLDGTGPRLTVQLPYLVGLGKDLEVFQHIHGFSGGVAAYYVYLAERLGYVKEVPSYYFTRADSMARRAHRLSLSERALLLYRVVKKQAVYSHLPHMCFFRDLINDDFFKLSLQELAPNFIPYVALPERVRPLAITQENGFDRSLITMEQVMAVSMRIPRLYSGNGGIDLPEPLRQAYDATYSAGYWSVRKRILASQASVILSMSDKGLGSDSCGINILQGKRPRYSIAKDILSLLFNLPNQRYSHDLMLAYR